MFSTCICTPDNLRNVLFKTHLKEFVFAVAVFLFPIFPTFSMPAALYLTNQNYQFLYRRQISSFSLLLSWSVSTGEVHTLDISPITKTYSKSEKQIFREGCKIVADLHRKYSVPFLGLSAVQAISNHNVFTGKTLEVIKHPFQPIAIVL